MTRMSGFEEDPRYRLVLALEPFAAAGHGWAREMIVAVCSTAFEDRTGTELAKPSDGANDNG